MNDVLNGRVLLLNRSWMPLTTITVRKAMQLLFGDMARAVDHRDYSTYDFESWADLAEAFEDGDFVFTPRMKIPVPDVLVLDDYNAVPVQKAAFSRKNLYKRDHYTCQYCCKKPPTSELTIDHIVPRSHGGRSEWTNCVLACIKCNSKKGAKTLAESGLKLAAEPVEPPRQRIMFAFGERKVSWDKFLSNPKIKDQVASEVYWNSELVD